MTLLIVLLLLVALGVAVWLRRGPVQTQPLDSEAVAKAAVDLHRVRRQMEIVQVQHEQRQTAIRVQREIAEALDDDAS